MKGISRIIDMLVTSGKSGDISLDSDGLLECLAKSEHKPQHWWEIPYQKGLRLVLVLSVTVMMLTIIIYYGIRYINDVILYENQLTINEQGAFNPRKSLNCEYALYLFNTADLWANSGIQVNKKDRIRINISGACNSSVEGAIVAAVDNTEQKYQWVYYKRREKEKKTTDSINNDGIEYCVSEKREKSKQEDFDFGSVMFIIAPESGSLQYDPIHGLNGDPLDITKLNPEENQRFKRANKSGTLYFAVNDMYFENDSIMKTYYKNEKHKNFRGKPFNSLEIAARKGRPKHDYEDNLGQLLVSIEIQRHVPGWFFYPSMAYRFFEYNVNESLDYNIWGSIGKYFRCFGCFCLFAIWISFLFGLYVITLLVLIYFLFLGGHWMFVGLDHVLKRLRIIT